MDALELVLISREQVGEDQTTADYSIHITLGDNENRPGPVSELSAADWPGSRRSTAEDYKPKDYASRSHALAGFSSFGSGDRNEFATWIQGRETFLSDSKLREACEEDVRTFAERSDHTEGFMLSTPISNGFGGFASVFLETIRDDFTKHAIFTTAMLSDSLGWKRADTERSSQQRLLNNTLSMQHLEELSSMVLPIQPPAAWDEHPPWTRFLRDDLPKRETYSQVLTMHLQSANSELREIDGLNQVVSQLNWRGDNKIAHLLGATPLLPPEHLIGPLGIQMAKDSPKDFSVLPNLPPRKASARAEDPNTLKPFAQYNIIRGYEDEELEKLGTILESTTTLVEPLSIWVALPSPYPLLATSPPIFRSLIPSGRPLSISAPLPTDPFSPAGLFGLPDPLFPTASTYFVQPTSIPLLTTLSTSPAARHFLGHLSSGVKELLRVRSPFLVEYENGEYALGREGLVEAKERLETLKDNFGEANGGRESESDGEEGGQDEDEDFDD